MFPGVSPLRHLTRVLPVVKLLTRGAVVVAVTAVGWLLVGETVRSGRLPPEPLGLAALWLPPTLFGVPTAYAGAVLLLGGLVLFGEGGGSSTGGWFAGGGDGGGQ
jgi:hypothetical protein